jgi:hypothetical protein
MQLFKENDNPKEAGTKWECSNMKLNVLSLLQRIEKES